MTFAVTPRLTGVCAQGDHRFCQGRVYTGHETLVRDDLGIGVETERKVATYDSCQCACHAKTLKAAA